MLISKKCQYALRAVFELAKRYCENPLKIAGIAQAQAIPSRFLEVILCEMKKGGFVQSQRGNEGGYSLAVNPEELTVGEVIRFIQGPMGPVSCLIENATESCPFLGECVFLPMWEKVQKTLSSIYDSTTFAELVEQEKRTTMAYAPSYSI